MGLDQYAYVALTSGQRDAFWESATYNRVTDEFSNPHVAKPREIAYWRKHPNLQGWMKQLWIERDCPQNENQVHDASFNGVELELTFEDLERLERDVKAGKLPSTTGFFFGEDSDEFYKKSDLKFILDAKAELFMGLRVFYNSSW